MATKRKATRKTARTTKMATVQVGTFDAALKTVLVDKNTTVGEAFAKAGIEIAGGSLADIKGNDIEADDTAKAGATYYVTQNYSNGSQ